MRRLGLAAWDRYPVFWEDQRMSGEVPIEIEDKPTAISIMRELVKRLQDTIEALKREIVRNPKSDEYRKALKGTGERLTIAKQNPSARRGKSVALTMKGPTQSPC
jgi:hypothetical protein